MSTARTELSPARLGAEVLVEVAVRRRDATLVWRGPEQQWRVFVRQGRPERIADATGRQSASRPHVVAVVRALALAASGELALEELPAGIEPALRLDTLGEVAAALCRSLTEDRLAAIAAARGALAVTPTATFDAVSRSVAGLCGEALPRPAPATRLSTLLAGKSLGEQRGWVTLAVLGALRLDLAPHLEQPAAGARPAAGGEAPAAAARPATATGAEPTAAAAPPQEPERPDRPAHLPADPGARRLALEIHAAWNTAPRQTHYELLGVAADASTDAIRQAYFEVAKRWHSDRFAGVDLGEEARDEAEELFARAAEAHKLLVDPEQRKSYDFVLDRQAKGLPTDVNAILEAEGLFRKAQILVRRGQTAAAEPLVRQAIELNAGEADFWAYLGLAVHAAQGEAGLEEANAALHKALEMDPKLAVAHEFLGRIARVGGRLHKAQSHFKRALQLNPKSVDAARELRLVNTRLAKAAEEKKGLAGLLGGLIKR